MSYEKKCCIQSKFCLALPNKIDQDRLENNYAYVHIKEIQLKCKKLSNIKSTTILNDRTTEEKCIAMKYIF
uniref:Uncharacterized protein n=1 Tax=Schistosoma haematobium TaxID=6185 RepID=A0A094ZVD8_SCHHA